MTIEATNLGILAAKAELEANRPCLDLNRRPQLLDLARRYREAQEAVLIAQAPMTITDDEPSWFSRIFGRVA